MTSEQREKDQREIQELNRMVDEYKQHKAKTAVSAGNPRAGKEEEMSEKVPPSQASKNPYDGKTVLGSIRSYARRSKFRNRKRVVRNTRQGFRTRRRVGGGRTFRRPVRVNRAQRRAHMVEQHNRGANRAMKYIKKQGVVPTTKITRRGMVEVWGKIDGKDRRLYLDSNGANDINSNMITATANNYQMPDMPIVQASTSPMLDFVKSLQEPGTVNAPFVASGGVVPQATSVSRGNDVRDFDNTKMNLIATGVGVGALKGAAITDLYPCYGVRTGVISTDVTVSTDSYGAAGEWITVFGGVTNAMRIVPWSISLDIVILAPGAVIAGNIWVGNLPYSVFTGATMSELMQYASAIKAETPGNIYTLKSVLYNRDAATKPQNAQLDIYEERVSYILFSTGTVGSIAGSPPASYSVEIFSRVNYLWVPVRQPQITQMTEAIVKANALYDYSAEELNELNKLVGLAATSAGVVVSTGEQVMGNAAKTVDYSEIAIEEEPPKSWQSYVGQIADVKYILNCLIPRWGDFEAYPPEVDDAMTDLVTTCDQLISVFESMTKQNKTLTEEFYKLPTELVWKNGKKFRRRVKPPLRSDSKSKAKINEDKTTK